MEPKGIRILSVQPQVLNLPPPEKSCEIAFTGAVGDFLPFRAKSSGENIPRVHLLPVRPRCSQCGRDDCLCGQVWLSLNPTGRHTRTQAHKVCLSVSVHRVSDPPQHSADAPPVSSKSSSTGLIDSQPNCEFVLYNIPEIHGRCFLWNVMNLAVHSEVWQEIRNLPVGSVSYDPFPLSQRQEDSRVLEVIRQHQAASSQHEVSCHCTKCALGNKSSLS